jgi:DNA primase
MTINLLQAKQILDKHLGTSDSHRNNEISYYCPFCNHYKKKLQVNLSTQKWHCWVCDNKGQTIGSLLRKSNAPIETLHKIKDIYGESRIPVVYEPGREIVSLPTGYKPLYEKQNTPDYRNALHYVMKQRGLSAMDILRYQVGYCEEGPYAGMIVIPSFDSNNNLNYYVGRSYYKSTITHKNPPVSKDVIGFENQINWKEPIVIVEGAFDAIATKRNAIPLFGKKILSNLRARILTEKVKTIYLALDGDAFADSVKEIEYFLNNDIKVGLISLPGKDPSEVGYVSMVDAIANAKRVDFFDLVKFKMLL